MKYLKLYEHFRLFEANNQSNLKKLVLLQDRKKDKNILIIPGTGEGDAGSSSDYDTLTPKLSNEYNVYSCNWPSNFNVEQYAKECVEDIKTIGGKWTVGGYSFGYRIAYKIAKVLEEEKSTNFLYKIFGIDGGVPASKEEEMKCLLRDNRCCLY